MWVTESTVLQQQVNCYDVSISVECGKHHLTAVSNLLYYIRWITGWFGSSRPTPAMTRGITRSGRLGWNAGEAAQQVGLGSGAGLSLGRAGMGRRRQAISNLPYATTWCKTGNLGMLTCSNYWELNQRQSAHPRICVIWRLHVPDSPLVHADPFFPWVDEAPKSFL